MNGRAGYFTLPFSTISRADFPLPFRYFSFGYGVRSPPNSCRAGTGVPRADLNPSGPTTVVPLRGS